MKNSFVLLLLIFASTALYSQTTGSLSGKIISKNNNPIEKVAVQLKESQKTAITKADGSFSISNLPYGTYTVFTSALGFDPTYKTIKLSEEKPIYSIKIKLIPHSYDLQEVELLGRKRNNYVSDYSFIGTKTASHVIDVPQSIATVTKELMDDQQAFTLNDVVKNVAGVNQYSSYDDLTVRGFRNGYQSGFRLVNGLRSGYSYGNGFFRVPLTVNLERVEVLKGPGAALFGDINPGGTINMVTKKPLDKDRKAVKFSVGSFQTVRSTLDFTGPLNTQKTLLYRLNVGYEDTKTFRDFNNRKSFIVAPSVTFLPTDKTTINAELVYSNFNGYLDRGLPIEGGNLFALPLSFALNQPNDYFKVKDLSVNMSLNHKFSEKFSFNLAYMKFAYNEDLREHRTLNTFADAPQNTIMNMRYFERQAKEYTDNVSSYFSLKANTGKIKHKLIAGLDYVRFSPDKNSAMIDARAKVVAGDTIPLRFDLKNPVYEIKHTDNYIERPTPQFFIDYLNSAYHTTGIYVQDQVSLSNRLDVLLGLRYEFYRDERDYGNGEEEVAQNTALPRLGITYALKDNINFFASYSQGFKPVKAQFVKFPERYGQSNSFKNETSYQVETGFKGEFFNNSLISTISLYQIEKRNTLQNTGFLTDEGNPIYRQNGKAISRGIEAEISGNLNRLLSINANYAYNYTKIEDASVAAENDRMAANAPKHSAGLWLKYSFSHYSSLNGFGLAIGGQALSKRRMELQVQDINTGDLIWDYWPSYAIANAAIFYKVNKFNISININNIFNKKYFVGGYDYFRASPGKPANFITSVGYTF
ncbi:TonB-dependent siderophore receptor [Zunongwangia sp.]|uniref:TonB-dependent siderophore receptor n=1 Tax=Zunongwangia sp. TaxID=1965325 RepID=UPI003AA934CF